MKMKKIIFLDRDGVINRNPVYLDFIKKPSEFHFLPGARKAIRMLKSAGFGVMVISNQSGVATGLFSRKDLKDIDKKMIKGLKRSGTTLDRIRYCIHRRDANCACRKPRTGLIRKAVGKTRIDCKNSFFVGDTERDAAAGKNFGIKTIAVLSGYNSRKYIKKWKLKPDFIAKDLLAAVQKIILKRRGLR